MSFLLNDFFIWNPDLVEKMINCSHHSINHNYTSPHHLEDSVFNHTLFVLNKAIEINKIENCIELEIAALCHDIGKVYTRFWNIDNNKICFYGHEIYSIEHAIKFCNFLNEKYKNYKIKSQFCNSFCSTELVVYLVANHMKKVNKFTYLNDWVRYLLLFQNCDNLGRICDDKNTEMNDNMLETLPINLDTETNPDFLIMSGIPGSGKDTWARSLRYKILSYDDIRIELYKKATGDTYYQNAWNWCNENKIDLNKYLIEKIKENRYNVAICNTNLTVKARRKMMNLIKSVWKDCTIGSVYLWVNEDVAIERDLKRKDIDKSVGDRVINKFFKRQSLPCHYEVFDDYKIVINN
jgi:predicted kinase